MKNFALTFYKEGEVRTIGTYTIDELVYGHNKIVVHLHMRKGNENSNWIMLDRYNRTPETITIHSITGLAVINKMLTNFIPRDYFS